MANAVVTSTGTTIKVEFNAVAPVVGYDVGYYQRSSLAQLQQDDTNDVVLVNMRDGSSFVCSLTGANNSLPIDTINGATPADNADLATKLAALMV